MKIQRLKELLERINDPRRQYGFIQHKLVTIAIIAFCAIICGANDFEDIEDFGNIRKEWFEKILEIPNGIPGKDTFRRVFERLNPSEVAECLYGWLENREVEGKTINIDGKTICGSKSAAHPQVDSETFRILSIIRNLKEIKAIKKKLDESESSDKIRVFLETQKQ